MFCSCFFYYLVCHAFVVYLLVLTDSVSARFHVCLESETENVLPRPLKREKQSLTLDGSAQLYDTAHVLHIRLFGWQHISVLVVRRCISQCSRQLSVYCSGLICMLSFTDIVTNWRSHRTCSPADSGTARAKLYMY